MTATASVVAGNTARITSVLTALTAPGGNPTAVVCITKQDGTLIGTLASPTVTVVGLVVTVIAEWTIPDNQAGGVYIATIDTSGTLVAADEVRFLVAARNHTDPHV